MQVDVGIKNYTVHEKNLKCNNWKLIRYYYVEGRKWHTIYVMWMAGVLISSYDPSHKLLKKFKNEFQNESYRDTEAKFIQKMRTT